MLPLWRNSFSQVFFIWLYRWSRKINSCFFEIEDRKSVITGNQWIWILCVKLVKKKKITKLKCMTQKNKKRKTKVSNVRDIHLVTPIRWVTKKNLWISSPLRPKNQVGKRKYPLFLQLICRNIERVYSCSGIASSEHLFPYTPNALRWKSS